MLNHMQKNQIMEYQSFGRPQRPKGACMKQALKAILVMAVCAWLAYQTKNSMSKRENYGDPRLIVEAELLGQKGIPSRLDERALPKSQDVDSAGEAKESNDGAIEDKVEEEFGHINGKFGTNEGRTMEHEPESQPKVSSKNKYKEIEVQLREKQSAVQIKNNAKSDFSAEESDVDSAEETKTQESVVESSTDAGATEGTEKVLSFSDENGVPPDGDEIKSVVGQAHILHEESTSNSIKGNEFQKSNIYEVTSREDGDAKVNLEGSKNDATADQEFNSRTFTHIDTSGINSNSETGEGDSQAF